MTRGLVPARMSLDDCMRNAARANRRASRQVRLEKEKALSIRSYTGPYQGGRMTRLEWDWIASNLAADEEIKRDAYRLRARARDLARNNRLAKNYLRLAVNNVIGPQGFAHEAQVTDNSGELNEKLNTKIEVGFAKWSEAVSLDGRLSLTQFERQLFSGARRDGEAIARIWRGSYNDFGIALEAIDPDLLDYRMNREATETHNEIRMGIEVDSKGRRIQYHFIERPYPSTGMGKTFTVPADEIIHVFDPDRVNSSRGVTDFHAVMLALHSVEEYSSYELISMRTAAAKPVIWQKIEGALPGSGGSDYDLKANQSPPIEELEPGLVGFAPNGYKPAVLSLDHPSTAFEAFITDQKHDISAGLGVSYAELTGNYGKINFSSQRSSLLSARETWRAMQAWWITSWKRPMYEAFMNEARLIGLETGGSKGLLLDTRDPARFLAVKFTPRGWPWVDPLKDINADIAALGYGLDCATDILAEQGKSFEDIANKRARELKLLKKLGVPATNEEAKALAIAAAAQAAADEAAGNSPVETPAGG